MFKILSKLKLGKGEKGMGMVEMALVTPVLMIMAFGLYDVSNLLHSYFIAHKTAQKTLRYAVAVPGLEGNQMLVNPHNSHGTFSPSKHGAVIERAEFLLQGYGLMRPHDPASAICGYFEAPLCLVSSGTRPYVESLYNNDPCVNTVEITISVETDTFLTGYVTGNNSVAVSVVGPYLFAPNTTC